MDKKKIIIIIAIILVIIIGIIAGVNIKNKKNESEEPIYKHDNSKVISTDYPIDELDKIYKSDVAKNYKDIRDLSENYDSQAAQQDNCFIVGAMVHNDYLYNEFMEKYKNDEDAFIRVGQNTIEGDLFLTDLFYDSQTKEVTVVTDSTRDKYSSEEGRIIKFKKYDSIAEYNFENHLYWVTYNGELNDETFASDDVYIIVTIN